ncbi:hypothetical protein AGDE_12622 [Angomonas deanei]|nr:hypothetical protein AGDE_12622 [Angomonas deanei]|eukprot:EPY23936.1 hypothetical protein AGDE_12622 [Angomonas deanei]
MNDQTAIGAGREVTLDKLTSFASQGARVDYCWIAEDAVPGESPDTHRLAVVTASAQEGLVRVWDVVLSKSSKTIPVPMRRIAQCRHTLVCGQRISSLSVRVASPTSATVAASTFTGFSLLWEFHNGLLPTTVTQPLPMAPHYAFYADESASKILYSALLPPQKDETANLLFIRGKYATPHFEVATLERIKALFEEKLREEQTNHVTSTALQRKRMSDSLGFGGASTVDVIELPSLQAKESNPDLLPQDAASKQFEMVDANMVWLQQQHLAHRSLNTTTESFKQLHLYHAQSVKDLPVKRLTLEERLHALQRAVETNKRKADMAAGITEAPQEGDVTHTQAQSHTLGLSTIPLYQALHAGDESAVMELLSLASRNPEDKRNTVMRLEINYVLLLLHMLCQKIGIIGQTRHKGAKEGSDKGDATTTGGGLADVSARSPLMEWFQYIIHHRGIELVQLQRSLDKKAAEEKGTNTTQTTQTEEVEETQPEEENPAKPPLTPSPPKDYVAPLYHQYKQMLQMQDKLSILHGRLSIFNAVRPSEKNNYVNVSRRNHNSNFEQAAQEMEHYKLEAQMRNHNKNKKNTKLLLKSKNDFAGTQDDILFPYMFAEVHSNKIGPHVIRVKSRVQKNKKKFEEEYSDAALMERAQEAAKRRRGKGAHEADDDDSILNLDDDVMEEMDFDNMDQLEEELQLQENGLLGDDEEEDDEDDEEGTRRAGRRRLEKEEMLADNGEASEEDDDDLDSSNAEFDQESDDALSDLDDYYKPDGEEEDEEDDSSEEGGEDPTAPTGEDSADDDDNSEEAFHEQMTEALQEDVNEKTRAEQKKYKRIKPDKY